MLLAAVLLVLGFVQSTILVLILSLILSLLLSLVLALVLILILILVLILVVHILFLPNLLRSCRLFRMSGISAFILGFEEKTRQESCNDGCGDAAGCCL